MLKCFLGLSCVMLAFIALPANSDIQVLNQQEMATLTGGACDTCMPTSWLGDYSQKCADDNDCTPLSQASDFLCHMVYEGDEEPFHCMTNATCFRGGEVQVRICLLSKNCSGGDLSGNQACQNRYTGCPNAEELICVCKWWGQCGIKTQETGCESECRIISTN